ncbi:uncharacterized protein LOC132612890 [Lycium barbarum]|uniref:uncharacterized protein LOC132612890 n=1 Tax=Lycium barbarum TaxID=112863 RepID=UPI00293F161B|nr:uncharacterized protein LOC132612890 [Lycium barbarum]
MATFVYASSLLQTSRLLLSTFSYSTMVLSLAPIVPERARTSIYALDRSFESILASFAPPVVGLLVQHLYGFKPIPKDSTGSEEIETDRANAAPLAKVAISRGLNGIGLAIVAPAIQSLVADSTDERNRGIAFGWLQLTGNFGSILGGILSVLLSETSFMGIAGWRISFHLVGFISVVIGILVRIFAKDPHYVDSDGNAKEQPPQNPFREEVTELLREAKAVVKVPSFQILVAQGVSGSFPWSSLSFTPMWLELIGFSHKTTALLLTLFNVALSIGGLFGGKMGDVLAKHLPDSGRIILSQISSGSAIPLAAILLLGLPDEPSTAATHVLVLFIMGLIISWNAPATNKYVSFRPLYHSSLSGFSCIYPCLYMLKVESL